MTVKTDLAAISLTPGAIAAGRAKGTSMMDLIVQAQTHATELQILLKQIVAHHPNGDANLTALNAIIAELA